MATNLTGIIDAFSGNSLDGLAILNADQIFLQGRELSPDSYVPYTGATKTVNLGSQNIKTAYAPIALTDLTNLNYVSSLVDATVVSLATSVSLNTLQLRTGTAQYICSIVGFSSAITTPNITAGGGNFSQITTNYVGGSLIFGSPASNYFMGSIGSANAISPYSYGAGAWVGDSVTGDVVLRCSNSNSIRFNCNNGSGNSVLAIGSGGTWTTNLLTYGNTTVNSTFTCSSLNSLNASVTNIYTTNLNATNLTTTNATIYTDSIQIVGTATPPIYSGFTNQKGLLFGWNSSGGIGETDFYNNGQAGIGGFSFQTCNVGNTTQTNLLNLYRNGATFNVPLTTTTLTATNTTTTNLTVTNATATTLTVTGLTTLGQCQTSYTPTTGNDIINYSYLTSNYRINGTNIPLPQAFSYNYATRVGLMTLQVESSLTLGATTNYSSIFGSNTAGILYNNVWNSGPQFYHYLPLTATNVMVATSTIYTSTMSTTNLTSGSLVLKGLASQVFNATNSGNINLYNSSDAYGYPTFTTLNFNHDNFALMFDMYYNGNWVTSNNSVNWMMYKNSDTFSFQYVTATTAGSVVTPVKQLTLTKDGTYMGYSLGNPFTDICGVYKDTPFSTSVYSGGVGLNVVRIAGGWNTGDYGSLLSFSQPWYSGYPGAPIRMGGITSYKNETNGTFSKSGLAFFTMDGNELVNVARLNKDGLNVFSTVTASTLQVKNLWVNLTSSSVTLTNGIGNNVPTGFAPHAWYYNTNFEMNYYNNGNYNDVYDGLCLNMSLNPTYKFGFYSRTSATNSLLAFFDSAGTLTQSLSDEREKTNIEPINIKNSYDKIMKLNTYKFNWKNLEDKTTDNIGVLAQEISTITNKATRLTDFQHNLIDGTSTMRLRVSYQDLFVHNINATKYLASTTTANFSKIENSLTQTINTVNSHESTIIGQYSTILTQGNDISTLKGTLNTTTNNLSSLVSHIVTLTNGYNALLSDKNPKK
jgi:hypothetical protein